MKDAILLHAAVKKFVAWEICVDRYILAAMSLRPRRDERLLTVIEVRDFFGEVGSVVA